MYVLKVFVGVVLLCMNIGGLAQFILPLMGAVIISVQIVKLRGSDCCFPAGLILTALTAACSGAGAILYFIPAYGGAMDSLMFFGRILLTCLVFLSLFIGCRACTGEKFYSFSLLCIMHLGVAAVAFLNPILHFNYDLFTKGMAGMVYMFILMYVYVDMQNLIIDEREAEIGQPLLAEES